MLRTTSSQFKTTFSKRTVFTVPKLNTPHWIPTNIYSAEGFQTVWNQYQKFLSEKLTYATQGTQLESLLPLQLVLKTSKEPFNVKVFNYASGLHSNHFFIENILPSSSSISSVSSVSEAAVQDNSIEVASNSLIVRKLEEKYGMSWEELKKKIITDSEQKIMGQGYIFIVEDMNKQFDIIYCNNYGTPYYKPRQQSFDLNGGSLKQSDYAAYSNLKKAVRSTNTNNSSKDLKDFSLPLVAINLWDYAYLKDYGSGGRSKYLAKVLDNLNWNVINKRLFTH